MADFKGTILTDKGRNLLAKALTGAKLQFTKVQLGDGVWDESVNPESLTALVSPKLDLPINDLEITGDGTVRLRVLLTNTGLTEGFFTRELGIFAKDPDTGEEVLYSVAYAENPDYIPSDGVTKVENVFDVYTVVANAHNVTAVISNTVILATKQDIEQHNQSPEAHQDIREAVKNLQTQINNLHEGITPNIQEAINQHNQDLDAHPEQLLKFIWKKETRNPTFNDIPPYENALWLNLETGEIFVHLDTCTVNGSQKAVWKGQFGTIVTPSTVSVFDIFGDTSAVSLWRFDGNANDDGGLYNGIWYGSEQYDLGKFGSAAKFDGNSYILINPKPEIGPSFSISLWCYIDGEKVTSRSAFHFVNDTPTNPGNENLFELWVTNPSGYVALTINGATNLLFRSYEIYDQWTHFVLVVSNVTLVYKNGELLRKINDTPDMSKA